MHIYLIRIWDKILQCLHFLINPTPPPLLSKPQYMKTEKKKKNNILSHEEKGKLETHNHTQTKKPTFSDKLWTSAALLRFEEFRAPDDFAAASSINASRPSCV